MHKILKVGSRCRSYHLNRSPKFFYQLLDRAYVLFIDRYSTVHDHSQLLHVINPITTPISSRLPRPLHDIYIDEHDLYSISTQFRTHKILQRS